MRRRQVYVSVAAGKTETAVHIIHNIHICGCVKMHLFSFLCGCVMMKTMRSGKDEHLLIIIWQLPTGSM